MDNMNRVKALETSPNDVSNNRYSAPLNYEDSRSMTGGMNNRRSAPEFLTDHNS